MVGGKGQSTVEYIVLVTAVIGVMIAFLIIPRNDKNQSTFQNQLANTMETMSGQMTNMANRLSGTTP